MSVVAIIGIVIWVLALFFPGSVEINNTPITNPIHKVLVIAIAFPIIGVIFTLIGLLGLVFIQPLLELFGIGWFITANF